MTWNYRVGTYKFSYKDTFPDNPKMHQFEDTQVFCIFSAYYDKDGKLSSYGEVKSIRKYEADGFETPEELLSNINLMQSAFAKPIINLDLFPDIWEEKPIIDLDI